MSNFLHTGPPRALYGRQAHLWVHIASGTTLDLLASSLNVPNGQAPLELRYAVHAPAQFPGIDLHRDSIRYETSGKLMRRALAAAGWVHVTYTEERNPALPWLRLNGVRREAIPDVLAWVISMFGAKHDMLTRITTPEFGDVGTRPASFFQKGWIAPEPFQAKWAWNSKLNTLMGRVAAMVCSETVRIIGSAAEGARFPGDLDLLLDLRGQVAPDAAAVATKLLALARYGGSFYGALDPVLVQPDGQVLSRDAMGGAWIPFASRRISALIMARAETQSLPIQDFRPLETQVSIDLRFGPVLTRHSRITCL